MRGYVSNFMTSQAPYLPPMYGTGIAWGNLTMSGHGPVTVWEAAKLRHWVTFTTSVV